MPPIDLTWLHLPVWLVTAILLALGAIKGAFWIKGMKLSGGSDNPPSQSMSELLQFKSISDSLNLAATALASLVESQKHVATKEDLERIARINRHSSRNDINGVSVTLQSQLEETRDEIIHKVDEAKDATIEKIEENKK